LIVTCKYFANIDEAGSDIIKILGQKPGALPLRYRQYIRDEETKRNNHAQKISDALGVEYTFDIDWAALFAGAADKTESGWRLPETISAYTNVLANRISGYGQDELAKEQFLEETHKRTIKIIFDKNAKIESGYCKEAIQDGVLSLTIKYAANVDEAGRSILDLLGIGPGQLPLTVRMNIRDHEAKRQEQLQRIREATGFSDLEWDFGWNGITSAITQSEANRIGETYASVCRAAANRLESLCKDEMVKEAIVDALSAKKIKFLFDKNAKFNNYTKAAFVEGVLVFTTKYFANIDEIGNDIESLL